MRRTVVVLSFSLVVFCSGANAEARKLPRLDALRGSTVGPQSAQPRSVTPPGYYALSVDGDFDLGGFVFKDGYPFLHNDGGAPYGNTALGVNALISSTPGVPDYSYGATNTALGASALRENTIGWQNTASGTAALLYNTSGYRNTASGALALLLNTTGSSNTAVGASALLLNTEGLANTGVGERALLYNSTGNSNTAIGVQALQSNTSGFSNTAVGNQALQEHTTGNYNTAVGRGALLLNTTGNRNTAVGVGALEGLTTGVTNVALGFGAGANATTGYDNIFVANTGFAADDGVIRIGNSAHESTFIEGIFGATSSGGGAVFVNSSNQLGTATSSRKFKKEIEDMAEASRGLMEMRPVRFRYTEKAVGNGPQPVEYGLIAEEVAEVFPNLVVYDENGEPYSVRYHVLTPMLLNELQNQHRHLRVQWLLIAGMLLSGLVAATRWRFG